MPHPNETGHLVLAVTGRDEGGACVFCADIDSCLEVRVLFSAEQDLDMVVCKGCFDRLTENLYAWPVADFLRQAVCDAMMTAARLTADMERLIRQEKAQGADEALAVLVRAIDEGKSAQGCKVALAKAVSKLTGQGVPDAEKLVDRALAAAQRPLELPPGSPARAQSGQPQKVGA